MRRRSGRRLPPAKPKPPTPEEVEQERARQERRAVAQRDAARLIVEHAPHLIGQDMVVNAMTADYLSERAEEKRLVVASCCLEWHPGSREVLPAILSCAGPFGSDRMLAAWWYGLCDARLLGPFDKWPEEGVRLLNSSVDDLVERGLMMADFAALINGAGDPFKGRRAHDRASLEEFRAGVVRLAQEG